MFEVRNLTIAQGNAPLAGVIADGESGGAARHLRPQRLWQDYPGAGIGGLATGWAGGQILLDGLPVPEQVKGYNPIQLVPQHPELTFNPYRTTGQALWDVWRPDEAMLARFMVKPEWLGRKPGQLSGGELARIALLRALDPRTRLLIADEVTAQLDPQIQRQLWRELMIECEPRGLGMVIFSHQQALLRQICHRVLRFGEAPLATGVLAESAA